MGELYRISFPNGKAYIGITTQTAQKRFAGHLSSLKRGEKVPLYHALRKYGVEAATVETLGTADDWAMLCQMEREAIAKYGTRSPAGYNATDGGDGAPKGNSFHKGHRHSDETKARMSVERKGRTHTPEARAKIGKASRGNKHCLGHVAPESVRVRLSSAMIASEKIRPSNTSGHKGVSWCRCTKRWRAHITIRGKTKTIGRFDELSAAALARRDAERRLLQERALDGR